jgi:hypothetical protein
MNKENDQTSEGLNQIFEIINAKGDTGELNEIVENGQTGSSTNQSETVANRQAVNTNQGVENNTAAPNLDEDEIVY